MFVSTSIFEPESIRIDSSIRSIWIEEPTERMVIHFRDTPGLLAFAAQINKLVAELQTAKEKPCTSTLTPQVQA